MDRLVHTRAYMFARIASLMAVMMVVACSTQAEEDDAVSGNDALTSPVLNQALELGIIGEQATGYLGIVEGQTPTREVTANVGDINIKRRALYTQIAVEQHVTVETIAHETSCQLFRTKISEGHLYRDEAGLWHVRTADAPVVMPSFCARP